MKYLFIGGSRDRKAFLIDEEEPFVTIKTTTVVTGGKFKSIPNAPTKEETYIKASIVIPNSTNEVFEFYHLDRITTEDAINMVFNAYEGL